MLDECSMIDLPLMAQLLKSLPETMRIVFCGDVDQLPSVGPGCLFRDIIESGVVPVVRLQTIYRQSQKSDIILAAHEINKGNVPDIHNDKDLYFQPVHADESLDKGTAQAEREKIAGFIELFVAERITDRFAIAREDIQVLCPMRKMEIGTTALNLRLQEALNPTGEVMTGFASNGATFRVRDRVMQVVNDYCKEVFNGDIGKVKGWMAAGDGRRGRENRCVVRRARGGVHRRRGDRLAVSVRDDHSQGARVGVQGSGDSGVDRKCGYASAQPALYGCYSCEEATASDRDEEGARNGREECVGSETADGTEGTFERLFKVCPLTQGRSNPDYRNEGGKDGGSVSNVGISA